MIALGRSIRRARDRVGMTRKEVADKLGYPVNTLGSWERGEKAMRAVDLPALAALLRTTVSALLNESGEQLHLSRQRTSTTFLVMRDAYRRVQAAKSIEEVRSLFNVGIEIGFEVPPDAEEVTSEEWGRIKAAMQTKIAELGGIPRSW